MSRRAGVSAMLAAVGALLVAAPVAAAGQYEFVASDGTKCTLEMTHGGDLEPDAQWTIRWRSGVTCSGGALWGASIRSELWRWTPDGWPMTYPGSFGFCDRPEVGARRPCGGWTVSSEGLVRDLPDADYEHHTALDLELPEAPLGGVGPVWLVTPVTAGCLPGGRTTGCSFVEVFKQPEDPGVASP